MMKITNYCAVVHQSAEGLSKFVKEGIGNGWQPFGSICVIDVGDDGLLFSQAMIMYQKE